MKPRRYPYTGRLKKPARLMLKEWQQHYDNYLQSLEYREPTVKIDCKRLNDVEFKGRKKEPINLLIDTKEFSQHSCEAIHGTSQEAQE